MFKIKVRNKQHHELQAWLELPMSEYDLETSLYDLSSSEDKLEECDVVDIEHDYSWIQMNELTLEQVNDIELLNDIAEQLADLSDDEEKWLAAYYEQYPTQSILYALEYFRSSSKYWGDRSIKEVAEEIVEECHGDEFTYFTRHYFDIDAYANDLLREGFCETSYGVLELL